MWSSIIAVKLQHVTNVKNLIFDKEKIGSVIYQTYDKQNCDKLREYFRYKWTKNGEDLEISGIDYKRQPGEGTLIIEDPQDEHEGIYQCFAKNEHGTAVSVRTTLRKASKCCRLLSDQGLANICLKINCRPNLNLI